MTDTVATYMHKAHLARQEQERFAETVQRRAIKKPVAPPAISAEGMDLLVEQAATGGLDMDESSMAFVSNLLVKGLISKQEYDKTTGDLAEIGKNLAIGLPAEFVGGSTQLAASAVALGYNVWNMLNGEDWAWPEDFRNVPATTDYYIDKVGGDPLNIGSVGGTLAIMNPARMHKFMSTALKTAKALKGGQRAQVNRLNRAKEMSATGVDEDAIWKETGWYKLKDGQWRFVFSDADAEINSAALGRAARNPNKVEGGIEDWADNEVRNVWLRADEILENWPGFELYPTLAGNKIYVPIKKLPNDQGYLLANRELRAGYFDVRNDDIHFQGTKDIREGILHELGHNIQKIEGFEGGMNLDYLLTELAHYRYTMLLSDVAMNPEAYKWLPEEGLNVLLTWTDPALAQDVDALARARRQVQIGLRPAGYSTQFLVDIAGNLSQSAVNVERYLGEASFMHYGQDVLDWAMTADPNDALALAIMRYNGSLGEAQSRMIEALSRVAQKNLDKLPTNPQALFGILRDDLIAESPTLSRIPGVQAARDPVSVDRTFVTPSVADVVDPAIIEDLYVKPSYLLTKDKIRVEVLRDPSESEIRRWIGKNKPDFLRWMETEDYGIIVWDANSVLHEDIAKALGLDPSEMKAISLGHGDELEARGILDFGSIEPEHAGMLLGR